MQSNFDPVKNVINRLERRLGKTTVRRLMLSVVNGENNRQLADEYGLEIYDIVFLSRMALECAAFLLNREVKTAKILKLAG